ncbi:hypothetical protein OC846_001698 [Tilletia horrida]|uniref:Uncharacterized protein n=1 Tax=Tilletia horrida TaxID=155126 RepID=A0AAN6JTK2_9BASI|nr:hypothetical protein OC846_001698 [Tilletia horrida]
MRIFTLPLLLLSAASVVTPSNVVRRCVTELGNPSSTTTPFPGPTPTVLLPTETVTLFKRSPKKNTHSAAAVQKRAPVTVTTTVSVSATQTLIIASTKTVTGKPVLGTTVVTVTTGALGGGTTTITTYTRHVPAPSLADPALRRRAEASPAPAARGVAQALTGDERIFNHNDTRLTNGVDRSLFESGDDDPELNGRPQVYCSDVATVTVNGAMPTKAARSLEERLLILPLPKTVTSTVFTTIGTFTATRTVTSTITSIPVYSTVTKTSTIPAAPTATVVVPGYDVCNPSRQGKLYDWTAYQAEATAFGLTAFGNITDAGSCCAAAAAKKGALAWALCDGTNPFHASCTRGVQGPCFVTYLKSLPNVVTVEEQCQADSAASTFQYRAGYGQVGGPLQCASTYQAYNCFKPIFFALGQELCAPA